MRPVIVALALVFWGILNGQAGTAAPEKLPAEIYVFTSPACSHCATYHRELLPQLKARFVQTGQARLYEVDLPYDKRSLQVVRLADCMPAAVRGVFQDRIFAHQDTWAWDEKAAWRNLIEQDALAAGFSVEAQNACLARADTERTIIQRRDEMARRYRISATPTTVVVRGKQQKKFVGADESVLSDIATFLEKP